MRTRILSGAVWCGLVLAAAACGDDESPRGSDDSGAGGATGGTPSGGSSAWTGTGGALGGATTTPPCPTNSVRCGAECVDLNTNDEHCGGCLKPCADLEQCSGGVCTPMCPAGQESCGFDCVDVASSPEHCGGCEQACAEGELCSGGTCSQQCDATTCEDGGDAVCVDLQTSADHCGSCGNQCPTGRSCTAGRCRLVCPTGRLACADACIDPNTDESHCGRCDAACAEQETCELGVCVTLAGTGGTTATGGTGNLGGSTTGGAPASGGAPGTGGAATGGSATGGSATGGSATGGAATGGSATGGSATGGSPSTGGPLAADIGIQEVAFYQAVKVAVVREGQAIPAYNAPLVAARPALVRVFVAPAGGFESRLLEGRLVLGSTEFTATATISGASTDATLGSTLNFTVPAAQVIVGQTFRVSLHETAGGGDPGNAGAQWPASGDGSLQITDYRGGFRVTFVPLIFDGNTAKSTSAELEPFINYLWARYPYSDVEYTIKTPVAAASNTWQGVLEQVADIRRADDAAPNDYYYGLLPGSGGGVQGISYTVGSATQLHPRASVGRDATNAIDTFPHEIGHALGRQHAPCGTSGDSRYPYEDARLGVWGYDLTRETLLNPASYADYMSYCDPEWTSDYTFRGIAERIATMQELTESADFDVVVERYDRLLLADDHVEVWPEVEQAGTDGAREVEVVLWTPEGTRRVVQGHLFSVSELERSGTVLLPSGTLDGMAAVEIDGGPRLALEE